MIQGGNTTSVSDITTIPFDRNSNLSIKTVATEIGFGCLNIEYNKIRVGNLGDISNSNWVSLDGVRIYFE